MKISFQAYTFLAGHMRCFGHSLPQSKSLAGEEKNLGRRTCGAVGFWAGFCDSYWKVI